MIWLLRVVVLAIGFVAFLFVLGLLVGLVEGIWLLAAIIHDLVHGY